MLYCLDAKTGESAWPTDKADKTRRGECGTIVNAGPVLIALSSDAHLVVLEPTSAECKELANYKVSGEEGLRGPWTYPIVPGKRIFIKDRDTVTLWMIE
jgi:hypothetical protein